MRNDTQRSATSRIVGFGAAPVIARVPIQAAARQVAVDTYDLRGRRVRRLPDGRDLGEGSHELCRDLTDREGARAMPR